MPEEDKREDDLENSQSFLNPLGNTLTEVSPAPILSRKMQSFNNNLKVEDIKEEDEDMNVAISNIEERKSDKEAQNLSAYSANTAQIVRPHPHIPRSESFKSDGQLKLSQIERQLIEM